MNGEQFITLRIWQVNYRIDSRSLLYWNLNAIELSRGLYLLPVLIGDVEVTSEFF